jgi:hypothetical protein
VGARRLPAAGLVFFPLPVNVGPNAAREQWATKQRVASPLALGHPVGRSARV